MTREKCRYYVVFCGLQWYLFLEERNRRSILPSFGPPENIDFCCAGVSKFRLQCPYTQMAQWGADIGRARGGGVMVTKTDHPVTAVQCTLLPLYTLAPDLIPQNWKPRYILACSVSVICFRRSAANRDESVPSTTSSCGVFSMRYRQHCTAHDGNIM